MHNQETLRLRWPRDFALAAALTILILFVTRWPLAPRYLYYFDAVNFALALDEFNPRLHQPQPPGYPLFVGMTRILHRLIPSVEGTLVAAGLLAAVLSVLLIWRIGSGIFSRQAGIFAAVLLAFNPAFWFGGLTNPVRVYLALCSTSVALVAWRALRRPQSPGWLYLAFGTLGLAAGFRPAVAMVLLPLLLWVWYKTGASIARLAIAAAALVAGTAPWLVVVTTASGGFRAWLELMWSYSNEQFQGSSAAFGASAKSALAMAEKALIWNMTGALSWLWALPFLVRARNKNATSKDATNGETWSFLAAWFLPGFAFSALIHIGDPDQALATIPVLCVAGGAVLASLLRRYGSVRVVRLASAVTIVNAMLFLIPDHGISGASAYQAVVQRDRDNGGVFEAIRQISADEPLTIIQHRSFVTWRQISYYFPDDHVLYLPDRHGEPYYTMHRRRLTAAHASVIPIPDAGRVVLVTNGLARKDLVALGWNASSRHPAVYWRAIGHGESVEIGPHQLKRTAQ